MDELIRQIGGYLRGMWLRRWIGLAVAWVAAVVGAIALFEMPDKYEASARVYVDTQSILKPLMSGLTIMPNVEQQLSIVSRTLMSRPNVEKLIRSADLDIGVTSQREKDKLIDELVERVKLQAAGRENLFVISYRDQQPDKARRVVQALVSMFVESSLVDNRKDTETARRFIEDQIKAYEGKLAESENRVKEFKLRNLSMLNTNGRDYFGRMAALTDEINKARLDLHAAEQSRDAMKRELASADAPPPVIAGAPEKPVVLPPIFIPEIDGRIQALKQNLDDMLRKYTEQHPDVVGTRRIIRDLEEQKVKEVAERRKNQSTPEAVQAAQAVNPVAQQLKFALAEAEANVASLRAQVGEYENRYNQLKAAAQMVPQLEAEFTALNRDYEIQKRNYEGLVTRRETAVMSGEIDSAGGLTDFRVIDPPRVSPKPVAPNRLLMLPLVLLGALGAGLVAAFLASQVAPTFHDAHSLRSISKRPFLGTVQLLRTDEIKRRWRRSQLAFFSGVASLVGVYGAAIAFLAIRAGVV